MSEVITVREPLSTGKLSRVKSSRVGCQQGGSFMSTLHSGGMAINLFQGMLAASPSLTGSMP